MADDLGNIEKYRIYFLSELSDEAHNLAKFIEGNEFDVSVISVDDFDLEAFRTKSPDLVLLKATVSGLAGKKYQEIKDKLLEIEIPLILITQKNGFDFTMNGAHNGTVDYLFEPFEPAELIAKINLYMKIAGFVKLIEDKNKELEKLNTEKNEFLGLAAHDLKNPIYNISMLAKVIRDEENLMRDEIVEFSQDIVNTAERMLGLIKKLLDINAIEQGKIYMAPETINLTELANDIVSIYKDRAANKNITLHLNNADTEYLVTADRNATIQVLDNLVSNAIKYSPFGKNVYLVLGANDSHCFVEVKDEGPGISKEDQKKLFGKFVRLSAKPTGDEHSTGLGLSIVKKYVEAMNGDIRCESELGNGTSFIFKLPVARED